MESLYPFLYADTSDINAVLEQVRQSTVAKAQEIIELRQQVLDHDGKKLVDCAKDLAGRFAAGGRLYAFGNGGSASDAQRLVTLFLNPENATPLPAVALTSDSAIVTALCNDIGVEVVFSRQIAAFARKQDIAIALSTSGNSANLLRALEEASRRGLLTVGIAGYDGGKMAELDYLDYLFVAPSASVHRIQECQTTMYHALWELSQRELVITCASVSRAN
jgi:D-sedoheptulose 7-phosphate isomerase